MPKTYRMDSVGKGDKGKDVPQRELSDRETEEKAAIEAAFAALDRYKADRAGKEKEWTESYAVYSSWLDKSKNPFLANLFIPKVRSAVETVAAFLLGPNQTVTARPEEGMWNWVKAKVAEKWLDFIWRKRLDARTKLQTWVKQGEIFGNGVMKVGYDQEDGVPSLSNTAIEDIYYDFYEPNIQKSEYLFHIIRRPLSAVMSDEKYDAKDDEGNYVREQVVASDDEPKPNPALLFAQYERNPAPQDAGMVVLHEIWCLDGNRIMTVAPTSLGWRCLREKKNTYRWKTGGKGEPFRPFVKLRFSVSPLPNRAYDMGAVYPTVNIQKAFNDLFNQVFTNIALTNNAMWLRRKGASVNARDLVRRPGGIITVRDINADIKAMETPPIKPEALEMLNRLDAEFRESSLLAALAVGLQDTATQATMAQENFYTVLRPIQDNIADALSELGAMVLQISLDNADGSQAMEMFENDNEIGILTFDPEAINAYYDVRIVPDRNAYLSKLYRQKQLLEFVNVLRGDPMIFQRYPNAPEAIYRMWLEEAGFGNVERIFDANSAMQQMQTGMLPQGQPAAMRQAPSQMTNPETMMRSMNSPSLVASEMAKV